MMPRFLGLKRSCYYAIPAFQKPKRDMTKYLKRNSMDLWFCDEVLVIFGIAERGIMPCSNVNDRVLYVVSASLKNAPGNAGIFRQPCGERKRGFSSANN